MVETLLTNKAANFSEKIELKHSVSHVENMAHSRIQRELMRINEDAIVDIELDDNNIRKWKVTLCGQEGTRFAGQEFCVEISFPEQYPFHPPALRFLTPIDHVSVGNDGRVCMDLLDRAWSPALTAELTLIAALSVLNDSDEQILKDVKEVISELQESLTTQRTRKNHYALRLKVKELESKSQRIVRA